MKTTYLILYKIVTYSLVVAAAPNQLLNKADKAIHPLIPAPPELFDNIDFSPHSPLHNQSHLSPTTSITYTLHNIQYTTSPPPPNRPPQQHQQQ